MTLAKDIASHLLKIQAVYVIMIAIKFEVKNGTFIRKN